MKNIAIFFGGKSVEHDISIITALQVLGAKPKGYNFIPVYIEFNGKMVTADNLHEPKTYLNFAKNVINLSEIIVPCGEKSLYVLRKNKIKDKIKIDCAILCNHGHGGEDGSLQGLLELAQIPYSSSDVSSSVLCMDKELSKIILLYNKIDTPAFVQVKQEDFLNNKDEKIKEITKTIKFPCIVKPSSLGSSVGISVCEDVNSLEETLSNTFIYDKKIIVEKYISNAREFCCAVMKCNGSYLASKVSEVRKSKIYTFEEKYLSEKENVKNDIPKLLQNKIKSIAINSYKLLGCDGIVRIDFLYDRDEEILYVNEPNSIPGSLAFNLFDIPFSDLLVNLINEAIRRSQQENEIVYKFNSDAIEHYIKMSSFYKIKG